MDVGLIKNGIVENVISADSVERAQEALPGYDAYIERTVPFGPGWAWDGAVFTAPAPAPVETSASLTKFQFLSRIPTAKRIAIRAAAATDPIIEDALLMLDMAQEVRTDDPMTVDLVGYLQAMGYLSAAEAAAMLV